MNDIIEKKRYSLPVIESITLDCDISLAMESVVDPPNPNNENSGAWNTIAPTDPYKNQIG